MEEDDAEIARRIGIAVHRGRGARSWSQATLAEHLNVSVDYVSLLERGARVPSVGTLVRIAKTLGLSLDELVGVKLHRPDADEAVWLVSALPTETRTMILAMLRAAYTTAEQSSRTRRRR